MEKENMESDVWDCYKMTCYLMDKTDFEIELCFNEEVNKPRFMYNGYMFELQYNKDSYLRLSLLNKIDHSNSSFKNSFDNLIMKSTLYDLGYIISKRLGNPTLYYEKFYEENDELFPTLEWGINNKETLIKNVSEDKLLSDGYHAINVEVYNISNTNDLDSNYSLKMNK